MGPAEATDAQIHYGEPEQDDDLGLLYHAGERITAKTWTDPFSRGFWDTSSEVLTVARLLSPLAPGDVSAIRGLGLQYAPDPTKQASSPPVLCLFFKPTTCISGPEAVIPVPEAAINEQTDYEVELCVVIGKPAKDVSVEQAMEHVAG